jgi:hypothetical protein
VRPIAALAAICGQHTGILSSFRLGSGVKQEIVFQLRAITGKNHPLINYAVHNPGDPFVDPWRNEAIISAARCSKTGLKING